MKIDSIHVSKLLVSHTNPRFEPVKDQKEAIQLMLDEKGPDIKRLAEDILKYGLNPLKSIAVVKYDSNFLVLEGNRRIVALKLLLDPHMASSEIQALFQDILDKYDKEIPKNVNCVVFDDRNSAQHWLKVEHTGKNRGIGIDQWGSKQVARFNKQNQSGSNASHPSLAVFDFAVQNDISTTNVDFTSLVRLLSTPTVRNEIGLGKKDNILGFKKSETETLENIKKVFAEMSQDSFRVRDIYTADKRKKWIKRVLDDDLQTHTTHKENTSTRKTSKSTDRKCLIPDSFKIYINHPRINDIFLELQNYLLLKGTKTVPNAVAVLFRVFLEVSLDHYASTKGFQFRSKTIPRITEKIKIVSEYMLENGIADEDDLKYIRITSSREYTHSLHINRFHEYVHDSTIQPEPTDLQTKWNNLQKFFKILWDDLK